MKVRYQLCHLLSVFLAVLFCTATAQAVQPLKFKVGTLAPEATPWIDNVYRILDEVKANSPVPVDFVVYSGGVMGDEPDMVRKLKFGQLHCVGISVTGLSMLVPETLVMAMPFMFTDYDEVDYVFAKMLPVFKQSARDRGYILLGVSDTGFFDLFSKNRIPSADEIANQRVWSWNANPMDLPEKTALGITGYPVAAPQVLTSLQTGLLDTAFVPPIPAVAFQWHTQFKYYYPIRIRYEPAGLIVSAKILDKIPMKHRKRFAELFEQTAERHIAQFTTVSRKNEAETVELLKEFGIEEVIWPQSEVDKMRQQTRAVWEAGVRKYFSRRTLDQVIGHLADYRGKKAEAQQ